MSLKNTRLAELQQHVGQQVTVHAWVTNLRSSGKIAFAVLREDLGEADAAMELYEDVLRRDPASVPARLNRGTLLLKLRRPLEAGEFADFGDDRHRRDQRDPA